jgi:predicted nucleic acid-binding protein
MSGFLLDTNCVSEIVRIQPEPRVLEWMDRAEEGLLYLSVLTLGEIRKGVGRLARGKRRTNLETWLDLDLQTRFSGRILPVDAAVANRWGFVAAQAAVRGVSLPIIDGLLSATALHYDLTVVSRNSKDFTNAQVPVLNPWEADRNPRLQSAIKKMHGRCSSFVRSQ